MADTIEIYDYHEDGIVVMTDEEGNKGTKRWPSKENIVGSSSQRARSNMPAHLLGTLNCSYKPWMTLCATHLPKMCSSSSVSFLTSLGLRLLIVFQRCWSLWPV
jgi:hypothetical protein